MSLNPAVATIMTPDQARTPITPRRNDNLLTPSDFTIPSVLNKVVASLDIYEAIATHHEMQIKGQFNFQHLVPEERIEGQVLRLLGLMDDQTKKLAIRLLGTLTT